MGVRHVKYYIPLLERQTYNANKGYQLTHEDLGIPKHAAIVAGWWVVRFENNTNSGNISLKWYPQHYMPGFGATVTGTSLDVLTITGGIAAGSPAGHIGAAGMAAPLHGSEGVYIKFEGTWDGTLDAEVGAVLIVEY